MTFKARLLRVCAAMACVMGAFATAAAAGFIVKEGKPQAEIVIAQKPARTTRLAARELQIYVEKISGAKLAIVTAPSGKVPTAIYVGKSRHTDKLKVTTADLKFGAYRMTSGKNYLVLIGDDTDFVPIKPWPRSHTHWKGSFFKEWDAATGAKWGNPLSGFYKHYTGRTNDFGKPKEERVDKSDTIHVWAFDERGSFNAVCGFLRSLGVRWYMPGEIGEVVPPMTSIPLPKVDKVVKPDFPMRRIVFRFGLQPREVAMWAMHLGVRDPYEHYESAHGLSTMMRRKEMMKAHPEYYALYGGKRHNNPEKRYHQACLSSEGLFKENVRYARFLFDHYKLDSVSIVPDDAFGSICQCPKCEGKDTPERGRRGRLSDYVFDYVNRVAKELAKTHPDKKVIGMAYGTYREPPLKIKKLNPNVVVSIVGGREPFDSTDPEETKRVRERREAWLKKTDNKIIVFENYPFTARGYWLPMFAAHSIGKTINALKDVSMGEDIWLSLGREMDDPGFNHFVIYFTARMYWGGKRDVGPLLDEYCRLFYGPAGDDMKAFFEFCGPNARFMKKDKDKVAKALALFAAAEKKTPANSIYAKRIALVANYLKKLRAKSVQLAKPRGPVPSFRIASRPKGIKIDGKLDDPFWRNVPAFANGGLKELQTGRSPLLDTRFKAAMGRENIYFAIRCEERKGDPVNIATKRNDDPAIFMGDNIELLIETDKHSYYQITINPAGAVSDLDRDGGQIWRWGAQAEVATQVGEGYWTVEIRLPIVADANDPLHQIVGTQPVKSLPWYFNLCRQRIRGKSVELSAFSPTGKRNFHLPTKFAKLYVK
jgi:Domain of unknown function (DUF4838)